MAKHRTTTKPTLAVAPAAGAAPIPPQRGLKEIDVLAALAVALLCFHTYLAWNALNPDGVSYLDLANALRRGDWSSFVQGYWSPLYPTIIAVLGGIVGAGAGTMILIAHLVNGAAAIGAVIIIWRGARNLHPFVGRAMLAAFLLASAGLPRIEAVTPDVLLLGLITLLAFEVLMGGGRRWLAVGLLLAAAFFTKTSAWPWLALTVPVRLWAAPTAPQRRNVLRSSAVCLGLMLLWIVPMSLKYASPTLGSAGRLNYCWYLDHCDSRTPDTHLGQHQQYREAPVSDSLRIRWVEFDPNSEWTYPPWSDPTAWDAGVITKGVTPLCVTCRIAYWADQTRLVFGLWLLPLFLGILLPVGWLERRPGLWRELTREHREAFGWMLLGLAGLAQFIAVHTEPRLIAPFGLLLTLATLNWLFWAPAPLARTALQTAHAQRIVRQGVASIGMIAAAGFSVGRMVQGIGSAGQIAEVTRNITNTGVQLAAQGISQSRIVVIGPVMPAEPSMYLAGAHVVAQIPPASQRIFDTLRPDQQRDLVARLFGAKAQMVWLTTADAGVRMIVLPTH